MASIQVLSDSVINKIAAGEVVERPASVVKELTENALDAQATQVFVTLSNGGKDAITVLDNGVGMGAEDVRLAVVRHATSKLRGEEGLENIQSLGFRGEALASIAAVSRFELVSCSDAQQGGTRVVMEGGREQSCGQLGFPRGSKITVQDLFFNTPARRKFLRTATTEFQHIQTQLTQLALAYPQVHFRLIHNQRTNLDLTPCTRLEERAYQLFGEEFAEGMIPVEGREGTLGWEGLLSVPTAAKSSRRWQHLFINGRPIRHAGINHGIYQAYRTLLMKGRHPAFVLKLALDAGEVDVNVHPAKTEVRLRNQQFAHTVLADRLHRALMDASRRRAFGRGQEETTASQGRPLRPAQQRAQVEMALAGGAALQHAHDHVSTDGTVGGGPAAMPSQPEWSRPGGRPAAAAALASQPGDFPGGSSAATGPRTEPPNSTSLISNPFQHEGFHFQPLSGRIDQASQPGQHQQISQHLSLVGQLHRTYLLVQAQGQLMIVDQHAAHERILFEQYRLQFYQEHLVTERYLLPVTLELSPQNALLLEQYLPQWNRMGFEIEPFGRSTYLLRQVPALLSGKDVERVILEVLDDLALFGKSGKLEEVINEILERVACHSAIRAGMHLSREEMEGLVAQLEQIDINLYCPHGRPVWVELPLQELEKRFKRIV